MRTRRSLGLAPYDLVEPVVDRLLTQVQEDHRYESRRVLELREELRRAAGAYEALASQHEEAAEARETLETELEELAAEQARARGESGRSLEDVTSHSAYQSLHYRAAQLEQERNEAHARHNDVRRELALLRAAHERLEEEQQRREEAQELREEEEDNSGSDPASAEPSADRYPAGLPGYPAHFWKTLEPLPAHVRREALVLIARLAAGDAEAYLGAKPLNEAPGCWEQRVAKDYRLIYRGPARDGVFEVADLVDRKDLERWLRTRR